MDTVLLFGLRLAPEVFNAIAEPIQYMAVQEEAVNLTRYLDDFIVLGASHLGECCQGWDILQGVCSELGVPLAEEKLEPPFQCRGTGYPVHHDINDDVPPFK